MYVRASRFHGSPGAIDTLTGQFATDYAPKFKAMPGNVGSVLLVDRDSGVALALTYWRDRAALEASESAATGLRTSAATANAATIEDVQRAEILVMERAGAPQAHGYVRSIQFSGATDQIDAGVAYLRSTVQPAIQAADGFQALICGADRDSGRGFVSTVWATAEARAASQASLAALRQEALQRFAAADVALVNLEAVYVDVTIPAAT